MSKTYDVINKLYSKQIVFETKSGSISLDTDSNGKLRIGGLSAPGTSNTLVIDPINNKIRASRFEFTDGTFFDTALSLNETLKRLELKPNKIFFKYNGDNTAYPNQEIEIRIIKGSSVSGSPILKVIPESANIQLIQTDSDTYTLSVSEFNKANADTIEIQASLSMPTETLTDSLTIYKAKDGTDALIGGLDNPFLSMQADENGDVADFTERLNEARGLFTVLKGADDLTGNSSKIEYSVFSTTEFLTATIDQNGTYRITSWAPEELIGEAVFIATDKSTGQTVKAKFTVVVVRQGIQGLKGDTGSAGSNAKTVKLTADDYQIAYLANDNLQAPNSIIITATPQNHVGTVFYEFIVFNGLSTEGITLNNSISNVVGLNATATNYGVAQNYTFIDSTKTSYGKSKTVLVKTREGNQSGPVIAVDSINIIATKDGSDALEIIFSNNNHTFAADENGVVSNYSGGGSIVEAYIGNEQLVPILNQDNTPGNGQFSVVVNSQANITSGVRTVDSPNKRVEIGDPSGMSNTSDNASITYTINAKNSNGVSKSQIVKASFTKSKRGTAGTNALNGLLTNESHTIAVENNGSIYDFSSNPLSQAGGTFSVYFGSTLLSSGVTYSIEGSATKNGLTISINSTTGVYSLSVINATAWSSSSETFTLKAIHNSSNTVITKTYSITKSFGGANAKSLRLSTTSQTFRKDASNNITPTSITITANLQNTTTTTTSWTVNGVAAASNTLTVNNPSTTATMSSVQFNTAKSANNTVLIVATCDGVSDTMTIQLLEDGVNGVDGADGSDLSQIFDFSTIDTSGRILGWNTSTTIPTTTTTPLKNYVDTVDAQTLNSTEAIHGGRLAKFKTASNQSIKFLFTAYPISVTKNDDIYELSFRLRSNTANTTIKIGLAFYSATGFITNTDYDTISNTSIIPTNYNIDTKLYQFTDNTTVGSVIGINSISGQEVKFVRPYISVATTSKEVYVDKLYFGIKQTPNRRSGFFFDPVTGRTSLGLSNADIAADSGAGLSESKYDATANFEVIGTDVTDIRITRGSPTHVSSKSLEIKKQTDFSAIRFAGWDGTFVGTIGSSNPNYSSRASIRATYNKTGSNNATWGAVGGASIDFYTAPAKSTPTTNNPNQELLRARITDQGQFLIGYDDTTTESNLNYTVTIAQNTPYTFNNTTNFPVLAVNGSMRAKSLIIENNSATYNLIAGDTYTEDILPRIAGSYNIGLNFSPFNSVNTKSILCINGTQSTVIDYNSLAVGTVFSVQDTSGVGQINCQNSALHIIGYADTTPVASKGNALRIIKSTNDGKYWDIFVHQGITNNSTIDSGDLTFFYQTNAIASLRNGVSLSSLNFTGQHKNIPKNNENYKDKIGLIVASSGEYASLNSNSITINEALPKILLTTKRNQKNVFGVISDSEDENSNLRTYEQGRFVSVYNKPKDDTRLIINSLGEGGIWVCNINGNLENGDYITTCEISGYGMKQDDDLLHNYTVAKITCDCEFDLNSPIYICEEFKFEEKTYKRAFVGCTYHCG